MGKRFGRKQDTIDAHVSDELLLLAVDGELGSRDAAQVRLHLEACWTCRARLEQINDSITGVVEYTNFIIHEKFPPSEIGPKRFLEDLHQLITDGRRTSLWDHVNNMLNFLKDIQRRPAWIAAMAVVCTVALLAATFRPAVVSADELVRKAAESQKALLQSLPRPVIYQKFRIERTGSSPTCRLADAIERSIYFDPINDTIVEGRKSSDGKIAAPDSADCLKATVEGAGLNWRAPLSIDSFEHWEDSNRERAVHVERDASGLISIRSTIPQGEVAELLFTFRTSDFHPVMEDILFRNSNRIRITESFFEVFSMDVIDSPLLALNGAKASVSAPAPKPIAALPVRVPAENELEATEMRVRVALHSVQADVGDQIEIRRKGSNSISVEGVVPTTERKKEIESELLGFDHVRTSLTVPGAPSEAGSSFSETADVAVTPDHSLVVEDYPLLQSILKSRFPSVEARKSYVDSTLEAAQFAMAHAWALRRLRERYTADSVARLDPSARQMLELLIRDHVVAIRKEVDIEAELLGEILPTLPETQQNTASCSATEWRSSTQAAFDCLEEIQDDTSVLLGGSQNLQDPERRIREVEVTIQALRKQLLTIDNQVAGNFLVQRQAN
jgi:hypothetical protein